MKLLTYTRLQLQRLLLRPRLLLALPVFFFIAYRSVNGVSALGASYGSPANVWDALFYALSNSDTVYPVLTLLFLYLLGDLVEETRFGQATMLRLGSRFAWWGGKLLALFGAVLAYTAFLLVVLFVVAGMRLPLQSGWSAMVITNHTIELGLPYDATDSTPLLLLIQHVSLLFLSWIGLGLLGMFTSLILRRRFVGALASIAALLIGYIGVTFTQSPVTFPAFLLISYHLEFTPGWIPMRMVPFEYSIIYWLVWILLFSLAGIWISKLQDDPGMRI